jgi:hypothetical protein
MVWNHNHLPSNYSPRVVEITTSSKWVAKFFGGISNELERIDNGLAVIPGLDVILQQGYDSRRNEKLWSVQLELSILQ